MKRQRVFQSGGLCFIIFAVTIICFMGSSYSQAQIVMKPASSYNRKINLFDTTARNNSWHFFSSPVSHPLYTTSALPSFLKPLRSSFGANSLKTGGSFSGVLYSNTQPIMNSLILKPDITTYKITLPKAAWVPSKTYTFPPKTKNLPSTDKFLYPERYKDPFFGAIIKTILYSQPGHYPGGK